VTIAVLDTNVLVSALLNEVGSPGKVLKAAREGRFTAASSQPLVDELHRVLGRPHIRAAFRGNQERIDDLIALSRSAIAVTGEAELRVVERDPADNRVIEAAVAARADFIVTGDQDLLSIGEYEGIRIVSPARFLAHLAME
jgi:putative PIN family toxin of toxin-antitoxin system